MSKMRSATAPLLNASIIAVVLCALIGCESAPRNMEAVSNFYTYDFTAARQSLRGDAELRNDEQVLLNNLRLGIAALADGDRHEAERALGRSFDWLSTAGLNKDRTTAAVLLHEGVRIWKGEPFEQALAYHYVSTLYATLGDWENARAAATNALFRLTDFGADQTAETLVRSAATDEDFLETGYTAVDTDFALGFLMAAVASDLSGTAGSDGQFDAALEINPGLDELVGILRSRNYDTLLIVDYGKGPTKMAYGRDHALVHFVEQDNWKSPLTITADNGPGGRFNAVCDLNQMARDHRWNNLEDIRRAKSLIGDALIAGGYIVGATGRGDDHGRQLAALGMIIAGFLTKSGAKADTRYLEYAPQSIYLAPLMLQETTDLTVRVEGDAGSALVLPDFQPGRPGAPRAVYLRLHGQDSPSPPWLTASTPLYGNDHTGVMPGDYPWILGGRDVSTPSRKTLEAYQAGGHMTDFSVRDLLDLYEAEGIHLGAGMEDRPGVPRNPSYRHILEGGTGLFTPQPDSMGYKRLYFSRHQPYEPKSELVRNARGAIPVQYDEQRGASR